MDNPNALPDMKYRPLMMSPKDYHWYAVSTRPVSLATALQIARDYRVKGYITHFAPILPQAM